MRTELIQLRNVLSFIDNQPHNIKIFHIGSNQQFVHIESVHNKSNSVLHFHIAMHVFVRYFESLRVFIHRILSITKSGRNNRRFASLYISCLVNDEIDTEQTTFAKSTFRSTFRTRWSIKKIDKVKINKLCDLYISLIFPTHKANLNSRSATMAICDMFLSLIKQAVKHLGLQGAKIAIADLLRTINFKSIVPMSIF